MSDQIRTASPSQSIGHLTHIASLDGVRAASIILVILTHTMWLGPSEWRLNETAGPMGMSLFFCLSGFLIVSMISRNPHVPTFLIRRVLRIVPAMALYLLILVVLFGIDWQMVLANMLFVANYWRVGLDKVVAPTSHLWSLSLEMQFYVAIALATLVMGRRSVWLVPPAMIVVTLLRIDAGAYIDTQTHLRVDEILSGGTLALITLHVGHALREKLASTPLALGLLILTGGLWILSSHPASGPVNYGRPYFAAALVGVVIHSRIAVLHDVLESRPAAYIARISYALYIYHPLMIFGWMNTGNDWLRYLVKRPVSYALTLAAAHASTFFWEARWQAFAKRLTSSQPRS